MNAVWRVVDHYHPSHRLCDTLRVLLFCFRVYPSLSGSDGERSNSGQISIDTNAKLRLNFGQSTHFGHNPRGSNTGTKRSHCVTDTVQIRLHINHVQSSYLFLGDKCEKREDVRFIWGASFPLLSSRVFSLSSLGTNCAHCFVLLRIHMCPHSNRLPPVGDRLGDIHAQTETKDSHCFHLEVEFDLSTFLACVRCRLFVTKLYCTCYWVDCVLLSYNVRVTSSRAKIAYVP